MSEIEEITPQQAKEMLDAGEAQLVDVRQQSEWDAGRIPGATHIPLDQLGPRAGEIDPGSKVIFQCLGGGRSAMATEAFVAGGREAVNMAGGIKAWAEGGLPMDGTVEAPKADNS